MPEDAFLCSCCKSPSAFAPIHQNILRNKSSDHSHEVHWCKCFPLTPTYFDFNTFEPTVQPSYKLLPQFLISRVFAQTCLLRSTKHSTSSVLKASHFFLGTHKHSSLSLKNPTNHQPLLLHPRASIRTRTMTNQLPIAQSTALAPCQLLSWTRKSTSTSHKHTTRYWRSWSSWRQG